MILNYTTTFDMDGYFNQITEDLTTPGAVLLAERAAVVRMYSNGTAEVIVGEKSFTGCV